MLRFFIIISMTLNIMSSQSIKAQWIEGVLHSFNGSDGATSKGRWFLVEIRCLEELLQAAQMEKV